LLCLTLSRIDVCALISSGDAWRCAWTDGRLQWTGEEDEDEDEAENEEENENENEKGMEWEGRMNRDGCRWACI